MRCPHRGGDPGVHPFCPTTLARAADAAGKRSDQPCGTAHREERRQATGGHDPAPAPRGVGQLLDGKTKTLDSMDPSR